MRLGTLILAVSLLAPVVTPVETGATQNGFWWANMSQERRIGFVEGYITGLSRAEGMVTETAKAKKIEFLEVVSKKPVASYFDFYQVSYGQCIDGLNEFYKDYRNKRININVAILYVRDQVRGVPQTELDARLDHMRQGAAEPGYDER